MHIITLRDSEPELSPRNHVYVLSVPLNIFAYTILSNKIMIVKHSYSVFGKLIYKLV